MTSESFTEIENNAGDLFDSSRRLHPLVEEILALWRYRNLVYQFVASSIKTRYKRSFLGVIWTLLNPILTMVVLTLVFSSLFRFKLDYYPIYILSGLVIWNFFSSSTNLAMQGIVHNGNLLHRIYVPKSIFAVSALGTGLVNLVLSLIPLFAITIIIGPELHWSILVMPAAVFLNALFALGMGLILSASAVYFADMLPVYEVLLTLWLYATPVIYPASIIPERWVWLFNLNPMYHFVELFRMPLYQGVVPPAGEWIYAGAWAIVVFVVGAFIFTAKANEYAYRT